MVTKCQTYIGGRVARVTRLDGCGRVVYGPDSVVTTKGVVTVGYTANLDEGEEVNVPNFAGERCAYRPAKPRFLNYTVEISFCEVDPDLLAMMTGQEVSLDANGDVAGFGIDSAVDTTATAFALEVWLGAPASGGCEENADGNYGYVLLPFLQGGILGDFTVENAAVTFTISGATTLDGNAWGVGPYDVALDAMGNPAPLPNPLSTTKHLELLNVGVAPPTAECGARPLLDPDAEPLTDVDTTITLLSVDFDPVPAGADPWWIDFGDGTWDYSEDGSTITHVYDADGTYDYTAYRNDSIVEGQVTVTSTT